MSHTWYVLLSIAVGLGAATQLAMLGAMGRERGAYEATWISIVGTIGGLAIVLVVRSFRGDSPNLPAPLDGGVPFAVVIVLCAIALAISMRGLEPYLAVCGLFATLYLLTVGFAAPQIGAALFLGAATAGTLFGSAVYDHVGAFGSEAHPVTVLRAGGIAVVFLGVVIVRAAP
jgi:transporter family-2 protein